jgi:hypothetical protein
MHESRQNTKRSWVCHDERAQERHPGTVRLHEGTWGENFFFKKTNINIDTYTRTITQLYEYIHAHHTPKAILKD